MMSHLRTTAIGFLLLASLACQHMSQNGTNGDGSEGPASSDPAATIDGRTITVGELDAHIKEALFSNATSGRNAAALYDLRSGNLREMLDELIVENAASAANLSSEDYLRKRVEDQGGVPETEIATFYDDNIDQMSGRDLDQMREQIDAYLVEQRVMAVITDLRDEANTEILLEPTRVAIEAIGPSKGPDDAVVRETRGQIPDPGADRVPKPSPQPDSPARASSSRSCRLCGQAGGFLGFPRSDLREQPRAHGRRPRRPRD